MQRDEIRKIVTEQFYNSLTESGVQVTAIPSGQLNAMVGALADSLFAAIAAIEQEGEQPIPAATTPNTASAATPTPKTEAIPSRFNLVPTPDRPGPIDPAGDQAEEVMLWRGRPYLSIGTRYELTSQRLRIYRGILGNQIEEIELIRVKDSKMKQHMGERMLNIGDVSVISADASTPEFVLQNVHDPLYVRELLRKAVMDEKARRGLYYREDLGDENN
ncbi:MAG: PH domain-containing protein [Caldilineaceae bacterium]|nr:PH domain-containing protein [Caldilineaceae bacterium]